MVVAAPPREPTEGLKWVLDRIQSEQLFGKTIIVFPPVSASEIRARWSRFFQLLEQVWGGVPELPVDPGRKNPSG